MNRCCRAKVLPGLTGSVFWAIRPSTSIFVLPSWIRRKSLQVLKASEKFTWYSYFLPLLSTDTPDMMAELKLCRMARAHTSCTIYSYFLEWNAFKHRGYFRSRNAIFFAPSEVVQVFEILKVEFKFRFSFSFQNRRLLGSEQTLLSTYQRIQCVFC